MLCVLTRGYVNHTMIACVSKLRLGSGCRKGSRCSQHICACMRRVPTMEQERCCSACPCMRCRASTLHARTSAEPRSVGRARTHLDRGCAPDSSAEGLLSQNTCRSKALARSAGELHTQPCTDPVTDPAHHAHWRLLKPGFPFPAELLLLCSACPVCCTAAYWGCRWALREYCPWTGLLIDSAHA